MDTHCCLWVPPRLGKGVWGVRTGCLTQESITLAFGQIPCYNETSEGAFWLPLHSWIIPEKAIPATDHRAAIKQILGWHHGVGFQSEFPLSALHEGVQGCACAGMLSSICSRSLLARGNGWPWLSCGLLLAQSWQQYWWAVVELCWNSRDW